MIGVAGVGGDRGFAVSLTADSEIKPRTHPSQPSRIAEEFPWRDIRAGDSVVLSSWFGTVNLVATQNDPSSGSVRISNSGVSAGLLFDEEPRDHWPSQACILSYN